MAKWKTCTTCVGSGMTECTICEGTGANLDTDEMCTWCTGEGAFDCDKCDAVGGWYEDREEED